MLKHLKLSKKPTNRYKVAILIKESAMKLDLITEHYVDPLVTGRIPEEEMVAFNLIHNEKGKAPVPMIKEHLGHLGPALQSLGIKHVLVTDSAYFKVIAKVKKSDSHYGYALDSIWEGIKVVLGVNYQQLFYTPEIKQRLEMGLDALTMSYLGKKDSFKGLVIKGSEYFTDLQNIKAGLDSLMQYDVLTCDIESPLAVEAPLFTIAFAWDKHHGCAFDIREIDSCEQLKGCLRDFFLKYRGKLIYHNCTFDTKKLVRHLFMENSQDIPGMLTGIHAMHRDIEDTKILAYLATNTTAGNHLGLKYLAFEFTGNYALEEMNDISKYPIDTLMKYNLIDCLATWYVYDKFRDTVRNDQEDIYTNLFMPSQKTLTQTELVGMPLRGSTVADVDQTLSKVRSDLVLSFKQHPIILSFEEKLRERTAVKATEKLKVKVKTAEDYEDLDFNPNSNLQLRMLLYETLELPVLGLTDSGLPSTDGDTLGKLIQKLKGGDAVLLGLLTALIEFTNVDKILNTFVSAFKNNSLPDLNDEDIVWLKGNFNMGGTKSGRLSSSNINLQQLPSSKPPYAKPIKSCFAAPVGWVMVGADFSSLEDRISALLTKDPNKLRIYTEGYDSHCFRAFYYFRDEMKDIEETVQSVNSIKDKYPGLRQQSKGPTFSLTYKGTWRTLVEKGGFPEAQAKEIEANYHEMYKVSDEWVNARIDEASRSGYVKLAFGLKLRTPILEQVILKSSSGLPHAAQKEIKTAGNALGQSYGLLNSRAANEFMERVWNSKYKEDILPIAQIHDALYFVIKNKLGILEWINNNLIECMSWNDLPEIQHELVKLGAELDVFYPSWKTSITIPNNASIEEIIQITKQ